MCCSAGIRPHGHGYALRESCAVSYTERRWLQSVSVAWSVHMCLACGRHVASLIWSHSRHIAQAMNIDLRVNDWNSIFRILARPIPDDMENHLAINMIIVTLWTLYVMDKKLTDVNTKRHHN